MKTKNEEKPANRDTDIAPPHKDILTAQARVNVDVSDADKEKFFKCFLTDETFTEEYSLFNNKAKIEFRSLTVQDNNDIFRQISLDSDKGLTRNEQAYFVTITLYRFALSIKTINGEKFVEPAFKEKFEEEPGISYIKHLVETKVKWQGFKLQAYLEEFRKFESKIAKLTEAVQDPSFWNAAG